MNDTAAVALPPAPPPPPVTRTARVMFSGERKEFRRLILRGALLELCTAGFYRFWLATDIRRHLWSHTAVEGDAAEYTGTAKELLIGFLVALAILVPIYIVYFLIGIEAERAQAFASIPLVLFFYAFSQFAIYRARRYRATRTVWRGVRFWMTGSGWDYSWRACLWMLLTILTFGLALPWREAALERFKMRHTHYGDLPGSFAGTGWQLFKRGWWLWAVMMLVVLPLAAAPIVMWMRAGTEQMNWASLQSAAIIMIGVPLVVLPIGLLFLYPVYKAISWRWWVSGIRFGAARFSSDLPAARLMGLYWAVVGWILLIIMLDGVLISGVAVLLMRSQDTWDIELAMEGVPAYAAYVANIINYVIVALAAGFVMRLYLNRGVWERVCNSTTIHGMEAADNVRARGDMASALGEGFADSLDIGGL